uniref:Regulator of G protein signaling 7b n=3 Tax=Cyprinus carpio TaxID=7962 RepID=A0A8C2DPJ2_CYPCA
MKIKSTIITENNNLLYNNFPFLFTLICGKMEDIIARMQDEKNGIPIRTVKSFLSKIPSVFSGSDIVQWMQKNLNIEDQVEALHLGTLMAAHGYFFPISDHVLMLKDDGTFYRFQTPYFWPSNCWEPENTDYGKSVCVCVCVCACVLSSSDESLARLQRAFARKWEFIFMQAEAQAKVDKKRDKIERKILDSQERAFWDVHRPVPGCVNTTEADIKKSSRMKQPHKTRKSVYGLQNDIRSQSPTHTAAPEVKEPTEDELRNQIQHWQAQLDRHRLKMSKVAESLLSFSEQYIEYDPFFTTPEPSNPWISDDVTSWELEASKEAGQQRVKRWGFCFDEVLKDPVGREQFLKFLESEFSSENLRGRRNAGAPSAGHQHTIISRTDRFKAVLKMMFMFKRKCPIISNYIKYIFKSLNKKVNVATYSAILYSNVLNFNILNNKKVLHF